MWGITSSITDACKQAPKAFLEGLVKALISPPQQLIGIWQGLSPEDQELFKQALIAAARLAAKAVISADKGGKVSF